LLNIRVVIAALYPDIKVKITSLRPISKVKAIRLVRSRSKVPSILLLLLYVPRLEANRRAYEPNTLDIYTLVELREL